MARQLRIEFENAFYHITSRGIERRSIFLDRNDRNRFLFYLRENLQRYNVIMFAYVLMKNHYHLFIETLSPNLSRFMHDVNTSYTVYFNRRRNRVGPLLQGRYKSILVDSETYMLELSRYIHLNPVRASFVERAEEYMWSSFRVYLGKDKDQWVDTSWVKERLGRRWCIQYREFVQQGVGTKNPFDNLKAGFILGSDTFVDEIKSMLDNKCADIEIPASKELIGLKLDIIIEETCKYFQVDRNAIIKRSRGSLPRKVALFLSRKLTQVSISEVASTFSIEYPAVSKAVGRIRSEMEQNEEMKRIIKDLESRCLCL
ncbi:MAG: transposase [bacterium]